MNPDAVSIETQLGSIPFLNSTVLAQFKTELPVHLARSKDVNAKFFPLVVEN